MESKLQYFAPEEFWKYFKLWGQPVNVREQQVKSYKNTQVKQVQRVDDDVHQMNLYFYSYLFIYFYLFTLSYLFVYLFIYFYLFTLIHYLLLRPYTPSG